MAVHSRSSEIENAHFRAKEIRSVLQTNQKNHFTLAQCRQEGEHGSMNNKHFLVLTEERNFISKFKSLLHR